MAVAWVVAVLGIQVFIAVYDIRHRLVLNVALVVLLVLRICALVLAYAGYLDQSVGGIEALAVSAVGALVAGADLLFLAWIARGGSNGESLGMGDVKLVVCQGLFLSPVLLLSSLFIASVCALVWAAVYYSLKRDKTFPFAPALCIGFSISLLFEMGYLPIL